MNIIGNVTITGDIIEAGGTKTVNNYYGESCSKEDTTCQGSQSSTEADVFDSAMIESFVIDSHTHEVAEILISLMLPLCGKNKPQGALLPLYCAWKENLIRRPSYNDFSLSFGALGISKSSYSEYMPKKGESNYTNDEIDSMSETICARLKEKTQ